MSLYFAEITGDNSILEAEAKLRAEEDVSVEMSGSFGDQGGTLRSRTGARSEEGEGGNKVVGTMA
jgi:uncharacterized protein with von Willebrand factor type A (vWA) domain